MQGFFGKRPILPMRSRHGHANGQPWEDEIKFRYGGDVVSLQRALNVWPRHRPKQKQLRSTYFDTADFDFWKSGVTLRIRQEGKAGFRLGAKFAGEVQAGPFRRGELEAEVPGLEPQLDVLGPAIARKLDRLRQQKTFVPLFETRVSRTLWVVAAGLSVIEVALDEGEIVLPDGRSQALREIELELKDGEAGDLYGLAHLLASKLEVTLDFTSKSDRGFAMLHSGAPVPQKSLPLALKRKQTLNEAIGCMLSNILHHFVANWAALRETDAPEAVHQLRVSLRRMRSAFKILRHTLQSDVFDELREDAKQIASALGPARELDSFIAAAEGGALQRPERPPGCDGLMTAARALRDEHYRTARTVIDGRRSTLFVLRLQSLLARRGWQSDLSPPARALLAKRVRGASRTMLDRLHARALKKGRRLAARSDAERHDLRIALKDLRYGMEFFAGLFDHTRRSQKLLKTAGQLQDILGHHNDAVGVDDLVRRLSDACGPEAAHAAGYLIGWHAHEITLNDMQLQNAWRNFRTHPRFWR